MIMTEQGRPADTIGKRALHAFLGGGTLKTGIATMVETLIAVAVSLYALSIFFPWPNIYKWGLISLVLLLFWRYALQRKSGLTVPLPVVVLSWLFFLSFALSAALSRNNEYIFFEYKAFRYFLVGGMLVISSLHNRWRTMSLVVLLAAAALDGLTGILQYILWLSRGVDRIFGFATLSTLFAAKLAFIAGTSSILLLDRKRTLFRSSVGTTFLLVVAVLTWGGILLSGSRGTWLALPVALLVTVWLMDRTRALIALGVVTALMLGTVSLNANFRSRITSLFDPRSYADIRGSIGNRIELYKGAVMLFMHSPLYGCGSGDFQENIEDLMRVKAVGNIPYTIHAHNVFLQILATQGIAGFSIFAALCAALLRWGVHLARGKGRDGGFIVFFGTLLVLFSGLTDYYFASPHYASLWCLTIGMFAAIGNDHTGGRGGAGAVISPGPVS